MHHKAATGFEPVNDGFANRSRDSLSAENADTYDADDSHWRTHWWKALQNHPDLQSIVEAWPTLPDTLKAGILAMVRASNRSD